MILISQTADLWGDPRLVYAVAISGIVFLAITIWLFRRAKRDGRAAGTICLVLAILLHGALIWLVPYQEEKNGGGPSTQKDPDTNGVEAMTFSTFDPDLDIDDASGASESTAVAPLPIAELDDLLTEPIEFAESDEPPTEQDNVAVEEPPTPPTPLPEADVDAIADQPDPTVDSLANDLESSLDQLLQSQLDLTQLAEIPETPTDGESMSVAEETQPPSPVQPATSEPPPQQTAQVVASEPRPDTETASARTNAAIVPGSKRADFANRVGAAKEKALLETGGDAETEAAVQAALRFLANAQRPDGGWDPQASGAGVERRPLGEYRFGAGKKSTTGLTGLALLAMMGSGNTHLTGDYADNVYRGLAYLIRNQNPDGSLSGQATVYAASYCHSMAALAVCESAVMTQDKSAIESSRRAIAHTLRMQHPVTGGWRYTRGDPGDLSQLGWQAMVLDGGMRAGLPVDRTSVTRAARFLRSVRAGSGGLASYRPGEAPSRTMTSEALATRLLIGETVPQREINEAERYLLEELPGRGQDNYYYWYYATLALHQLQDGAWQRWNTALKDRLLSTQRPDGSWPASTVWGGYGGTVYTTAMATLCLETYYRHAIRDSDARVATRP